MKPPPTEFSKFIFFQGFPECCSGEQKRLSHISDTDRERVSEIAAEAADDASDHKKNRPTRLRPDRPDAPGRPPDRPPGKPEDVPGRRERPQIEKEDVQEE